MEHKDKIDVLFKELEGSFDLQETPVGHQRRFLDKLNARDQNVEPAKRSINWWKPFSIAASVLVLIMAGFYFQNDTDAEVDLASISPELEQTQSFFTLTINQEVQKLQSFESSETKQLVDDTLSRLSELENEYDNLKIDLQESGNDKRVISAMISNFQDRIDLLQEVIETIESIETLKANQNETTI